MIRAFVEFLTFRRMLGPFMLQVLFWVCAAILVVMIPVEMDLDPPMLEWVAVVFCVLALRLAFELILLVFRCYDRLGEIRKLLQAVDEATRPISVIDDDGGS